MVVRSECGLLIMMKDWTRSSTSGRYCSLVFVLNILYPHPSAESSKSCPLSNCCSSSAAVREHRVGTSSKSHPAVLTTRTATVESKLERTERSILV